MLSPSWSDLHALAVEPPFAYVTTNPELICTIVLSACSAQGIPVLVLLFFLLQSLLLLILWLSVFALGFRTSLFSFPKEEALQYSEACNNCENTLKEVQKENKKHSSDGQAKRVRFCQRTRSQVPCKGWIKRKIW